MTGFSSKIFDIFYSHVLGKGVFGLSMNNYQNGKQIISFFITRR